MMTILPELVLMFFAVTLKIRRDVERTSPTLPEPGCICCPGAHYRQCGVNGRFGSQVDFNSGSL